MDIMGRYLGIDYGEKRVGIAISDPTHIIAQPFTVIENRSRKYLIEELKKIVDLQNVSKIVLGLPITMKGGDSRKTREVRKFAKMLSEKLNLEVLLEDESMTSWQAEQSLRQMGKKPSRHKSKIDQLAAQIILQDFINQENSPGKEEGNGPPN